LVHQFIIKWQVNFFYNFVSILWSSERLYLQGVLKQYLILNWLTIKYKFSKMDLGCDLKFLNIFLKYGMHEFFQCCIKWHYIVYWMYHWVFYIINYYFYADHSQNCFMNTSRLSVKEFEEVSMRCSTDYRGGWAPSIHWQDGYGQRITAGVFNVTNSSHVTSFLNVTASASHHGVVYSCVILFDNSSQIFAQENVSSNTPSYQHTCSLPAVNISCK